MPVDKRSIGKIAERIVMNELEARGYKVTDLNKDGLSANADLIAAKGGKVWQLQVKGATNKPSDRWWVQLGYCTPETMSGKQPVFNRKDSFYTAQYAVLVAVKSPKEYRSFVMPIADAEKAAQLFLDQGYRVPKRDGSPHKPGKIWGHIDKSERKATDNPIAEKRRELIKKWEDHWDL